MPDHDMWRTISAQVENRWQALDPLLPAPGPPPAGCGADLTIGEAPGGLAATGVCEHWAGEAAGTLEVNWGAARRFGLTARVAGPDVADGLDELVSRWRDHLAGVPGTDDEDSAAVITWPSRDLPGVKALRRRGLTPMTIHAARTPRGDRGAVADEPAAYAANGLRVRRAGPEDIDTVARLGLELFRFDAQLGGMRERPDTAAGMRRQAAGLLAGPEPWAWLAERDGRPVGMLSAQRPEAAAWIAPMTALAPASYLMFMLVLPEERGSGLGAAMVARYHREADAAGIAVTLLDYEQANPLSLPFWSQQGYRPLWTTWEARPAGALR